MNLLQPLSPSVNVGPVFAHQKVRTQYSLLLNETPSLEDPVFDDVVPKRLGFLQGGQLVERYEEAMEQHVERRVAIFFQKLVACYRTGLRFEIGQTQAQGESAPALKGYEDGKLKKLSVRNAAHSSTIPSLIAYKPGDPQGFHFMRGTDLYRISNSTIAMPRAINEADIAIDGRAKSSQLREKSLKLLNQASEGEINPEEGVTQFLDLLAKRVKSAMDTAQDGGIKTALKHYKATLRDIQETLREDPDMLARMLDVQIDPETDSALARKTIYHIRYRAIRDNLLGQEALIKKIEAVKEEIFEQMKGRFCHKEEAFRQVLVSKATGEDQIRLRKLYNLPEENSNSRYEKTKTEILKHKKKIEALIKDLSRDLERLRNKEIRQRASVTKTLRYLKGWRQVDLSAKIKRVFPHLPSSQPTLSRIETGIRAVDPDYAEKLSAVFKVDPGLFMPHFFHD